MLHHIFIAVLIKTVHLFVYNWFY